MPGTEALFSSTKIFPTSPEDQKKIPLWLKFFCYDYTDNSLLRTSASLGIGPMLKCIMLPAPKEFVTKTDNIYDTGIIPVNVTQADPQSYSNDSGKVMANYAAAIADKTELVLSAPTWAAENLGIGAKIDMDMSDTKFRGTNKRIYGFKIILAARSTEDSNAASEICEIFESFSLPQARSGLFSRFVCHPPLWLFGIGPGQNANIDRQWSGQPQLSVLDQITVSKSGFQDSYGIADEYGEIKPLAQTINMTFVELEPALRSSFIQSSTIVNRSTSFWTFGGAGQDIANIAGEIVR